MDKYCYMGIGISEKTDNEENPLYNWWVMLFLDIKLKKDCGQLAKCELKSNIFYHSEKEALKDAKGILKALGVRKVKEGRNGTGYRCK